MSSPSSLPDRHDTLQKWEWSLQRAGWLIWGLIVVAGLAGLVGPGPLSATRAESEDGTTSASFDQFVHYHSPTTWELTLRPTSPSQELHLEISNSLLASLQIERVQPEPSKCVLREDTTVYSFHHSRGATAARVVFHIQYEKFGNVAGTIRLDGHSPIELKPFVFP